MSDDFVLGYSEKQTFYNHCPGIQNKVELNIKEICSVTEALLTTKVALYIFKRYFTCLYHVA